MADYYIDSNAVGAGTGADWANAYTTLSAALTGKAAGSRFFVAHNHAETRASAMTIAPTGTAANPSFIYCVNSAGSVPPVSADLRTTATITTTGASDISFDNSAYCYGIAFNCGTGANTNVFNFGTGFNPLWWRLVNCALAKKGTASSSGSAMSFGQGSTGTQSKVELENTTMEFGNTGDGIALRMVRFSWRNTANAISGAVIPSVLFPSVANASTGFSYIEGVDLSALGSGKVLIGGPTSAYTFLFKDCKLGASVSIASTVASSGGPETQIIRCDSASTNYRHEKYQYTGSQVVETTIVRSGGASDGATAISWKIVTTANSKWTLPFEALPIAIWNETVGSSVTITVYGIWGGGAVPNNDNIWIDCEYLGSSSNPQGSFISASKADNLASGSALASDSSTWGGSTTKFKMSVTFTPQQKGTIYVYVKAALASSTFYIDPEVVVS